MSLGNPRSIVKQTILLCSFLRNLLLMISHRHWFLSIAFLTAVFSAVINPLPSGAIAFLFCLIGLSLFPIRNQLTKNYLNWGIRGGVKGAIVLLSLIAICLVVPQVETNTAVFTSPLNHLKNQPVS
jgi:hypothetical protein